VASTYNAIQISSGTAGTAEAQANGMLIYEAKLPFPRGNFQYFLANSFSQPSSHPSTKLISPVFLPPT